MEEALINTSDRLLRNILIKLPLSGGFQMFNQKSFWSYQIPPSFFFIYFIYLFYI